jgi:hypothetical protein
MKPLNLISQKFDRLTVLSRGDNTPSGKTTWNCVCECGNKVNREADSLRKKGIKSCGCFNKQSLSKIATERNTVHGQNKVGGRTGSHKSWSSMLQRCEKENHKSYKYYGGRGIKVCDRWKKFENFFEDMGERPNGMSIDRIDSEKNYEPGNCKWSNRSEQQKNKRPNQARGNAPIGATGFRGVSKNSKNGKYISYIWVSGKSIRLGTFDTPLEAHNAYEEAKNKYFGGKK